jgi:arylsulfatase A-like enzyme
VLPQIVADSAYRTGYMGKWHLGDEVFVQRGFESWVSIEDYMYGDYFSPGRDPKTRSSYHEFLTRLGYKPDRQDGYYSRKFATTLPVEHCKPAFLASNASDFILKNRAEPWMLYVNFLEPHTPHNGPWNDLHSAQEAPLAANYPGLPMEREPEAYRKKREQDETGRDEMQRLRRNYAGLCSQVDQAVGRILWALEASGQAENTIIAFTSDHGEMGGSHGMTAKGVFYEEATHIPMLLRIPWKQSQQIRVKQPVSHIDVVPTLLDAMGRRNPGALPGESWLPLAQGQARADGNVVIEWDKPLSRAVVSPDGWKMALFENENCLLFDHNRDALEQHNLFYRSESAPVIRRLRTALEQWQRRTGDRAHVG